MSNGIGKNPLTDISKVYLETVRESYKIEPPKEKLKTDRNMFTIPKDEQKAAKERLLAKAAAKRAKISSEALDMSGAPSIKNAKPLKKIDVKYDPHMKLMAPVVKKEGLDPVGQEDGDVDNDGDKDKSDKYLMKRRKAITKAMKTRKEEDLS